MNDALERGAAARPDAPSAAAARWLRLGALMGAVALVAACGSSSDDVAAAPAPVPVPPATGAPMLPPSAALLSSSYTGYVATLTASAATEDAEAVTLDAALVPPTSETEDPIDPV